MAELTEGQRAHLTQLCRIFPIPEIETDPNPALAYDVLLRMYLVPTIPIAAERNRAVNEARGNLQGHFNPYSRFIIRLAEIA